MVGVEQPRQPTDFSTETLEIIEMIVITAAVHSDIHDKPGPVREVCSPRFSLCCGACRSSNQGWMGSSEHLRCIYYHCNQDFLEQSSIYP